MNVDEYLRENGVWFEHHTHRPVYTAQELAAEEHISGRDVAKAVVVKLDDSFVLCVLPAHQKLDMGKLCMAENAHSCRLAEESEMSELFPDVEVGAEPPMGNLYNLPTIVDASLAAEERIMFPAGSHRDAIEMGFRDFARLVQPRVTDMSVHA